MSFENVQGMNIDWNNRLDKKLDNAVSSLLEKTVGYGVADVYTLEDLNKKVNNDETLEEYIRDTEKTFNLERKDLQAMSDKELNSYVQYLDSLW